MIALTLLTSAGVGTVSLLSAALRNEAAMAERESTLRAADRTLAALALLTRTDLDLRLGRHPAGRFIADVRRPEPTLYRIALAEPGLEEVELLVTVVHRDRTPSP